jgi:hypothetical protein
MNLFFSGFFCGFTLGLLLSATIAVIIGVLAVLSLTMDASDLPRRTSKKQVLEGKS